MLVWIGRRWDLADPELLGRAQLFEFHFMPVTSAFPQFPIPPDVERYRREGHVFNATIFRVGHFLALALQHDWPGSTGATEARIRSRWSLPADLAYRVRRSLATASSY